MEDEMDVDWAPTQERGDPFPVSKPLTKHQIKNIAGGYVFEVTDIDRLHRFLCLGTELGYYKANSQHRKFSRSEVQAIDRYFKKISPNNTYIEP